MARARQRQTVRLVHFADYHAHAVPFYSEGEHDTAGIARLIAYLRSVRPGAVVTNGGDMFNVGSPAWSDRYRGLEWPWLNGLVDVMAFGNHDSDYGPQVFAQCRRELDHPILCANLLDEHDQPVLTAQGRPYLVHEVDGLRLGMVAAAGPDVDELIPEATRPVPGARFANRVPIVEEIVARMRRDDHVDAVVLVGHGLYEDDVSLARAVPGLDVVLGTHSHRRQELTSITGTEAVMASPFQYGTYVADLHLAFVGGALVEVTGGLVPLSPDRPEAPDVAAMVAELRADLAADADYAHLQEEIGHAPRAISTNGQEVGESELGNLIADVVRTTTGSDVALIGTSAIREPIPPRTVRVGDVITAMPYENQVLVYRTSGQVLQQLLDASITHRGTNYHAQVSGLRFVDDGGRAAQVLVEAAAGWRPLDPEAHYEVAVNDFVAERTPRYRDLLADQHGRRVGLEVREAFISWIRGTGHVAGHLDGRMTGAPAPATLP